MDTNIIEKKPGEYLIFKLMDEYFAFPAEKTLEIVQTKRITFLPKMAPFFCGVLNLRGELIPSVDLRVMLGMESMEDTKDTVFILLNVTHEIENYSAAVRVDRVKTNKKIFENQFLPPPKAGSLISEKYLKGCFVFKDLVILILSPDTLLSTEELKLG